MWQDCGCEKVTCDETGIPHKDHPQISRQNYPRHLTVFCVSLHPIWCHSFQHRHCQM